MGGFFKNRILWRVSSFSVFMILVSMVFNNCSKTQFTTATDLNSINNSQNISSDNSNSTHNNPDSSNQNSDNTQTAATSNPVSSVDPSAVGLTASFYPPAVSSGESSQLVVNAVNASKVYYTCDNQTKGNLSATSSSVTFTPTTNLLCVVTAEDANGKKAEVNASVSFVSNDCLTFEEIPTFPAEIPARSSGKCYYKKLFNKIALRTSMGDRKTNVLAYDHDHLVEGNPYIMGDISINFSLKGQRTVRLSSSPTKLSSIIVDNFILLALKTQSDADYTYSSYGTKDCSIRNTNYIQVTDANKKVNNVFLSWTSFAGTETIKSLVLSNDLPINQRVDFSLSALDCGVLQQMTDVYIVFQ